MPETDVGAPVVAWLNADGWEVFQEVKASLKDSRAPVADIVAKRGPVLWIIECKKHLGTAVLDQLIYWNRRHMANFYSAATTTGKANPESIDFILQGFGIGTIYVRDDEVTVGTNPKFQRHGKWQGIEQFLHEDQKTRLAAGSKGGNVSTPFQRTCDQLRNMVKAGPISPKDAIQALEHHYACDSTARSSLVKWAQQGSIKGVMLKRDGRKLQFVEWRQECE